MRDILGDRDDTIPDRPTRVAEPSRESQLPKRFYENVTFVAGDDGFSIRLDDRPVKTPGRANLETRAEAVAQSMAAEWAAQGDRIDPMTMPVTRLLNTAIDGVATDMQAVKEDIIRYAGTDMLCYRAGEPEGLVARQMEVWDPILDWAQMALGARLLLAEGIMHVAQPPESIAAFSAHVGQIEEPAVLAGAHVITSLTGSAVLSMAVLKDELNLDEAWQAAHLDEDWNIELWGADEEAEARRAARFVDMKAACDTVRAHD